MTDKKEKGRWIAYDYEEQATMAIIKRIIEDTSVPKTYRAMFKRYLEWREKR